MDPHPDNAYYSIVPNQDGPCADVIAHTIVVVAAAYAMIVDEYCTTHTETVAASSPAYSRAGAAPAGADDGTVAVVVAVEVASARDLFPPRYPTLTSVGDLVVPVVNIVVLIHYLFSVVAGSLFRLRSGLVRVLAAYRTGQAVAPEAEKNEEDVINPLRHSKGGCNQLELPFHPDPSGDQNQLDSPACQSIGPFWTTVLASCDTKCTPISLYCFVVSPYRRI